MKFLYSNSNTKAIRKLFRSKEQIKCAVSFWGGDASKYITGNPSKIKIVCNLESGATNPYLIKSLLKKGVKVKSNYKLHTKVYIAGSNVAIVGSSNASANGLSFEGEEVGGWLEASILVEEEKAIAEINEWFEVQWGSAIEITNEMIEKAREKWAERRNKRETLLNDGSESLLSALKKSPNKFKDKNIYFSIYRVPEASQEALDAFEEAKKQLKIEQKLTFWESWSELPENSYFISLYYGPKGGFRFEEYYYVPRDKSEYIEEIEYENGEKGDVLICFLEKSIDGATISAEDERLLKEKIDELWKYNNPASHDAGVFLSLYDSRNVLFTKKRITR